MLLLLHTKIMIIFVWFFCESGKFPFNSTRFFFLTFVFVKVPNFHSKAYQFSEKEPYR